MDAFPLTDYSPSIRGVDQGDLARRLRRQLVMKRKGHSYIDVTALADVGALLLTPSAAWVWHVDGSGLLWTNAAGAALLGCRTIAEALERSSDRTAPGDIQALATRLHPGTTETADIQLGSGEEPVFCAVSRLHTGDGIDGLLAVETDEVASHNPLSVRAARLAHSIAGPDLAVAIMRPEGRLIAASPGFGLLADAVSVVEALAAQAGSERPVKRVERFGPDRRSVGIVGADTPDGPVVLAIVGPPIADEIEDVPTAAAAVEQIAEAVVVPSDDASEPIHLPGAAVVDLPEPQHQSAAASDEEDGDEHQPSEVASPGGHTSPAPSDEPATAGPHTMTAASSSSDATSPIGRGRRPRRFTFSINADQRITEISGEFAAMVGPAASAIRGESWAELSERLGIDRDGLIRQALSRRDTWSGVTLSWPVDDASERTTLSLTALPSFDLAGTFEGFRGFGVAKGVLYDPAHSPASSAEVRPGDDPEPAVDRKVEATEGDAIVEIEASGPEAPLDNGTERGESIDGAGSGASPVESQSPPSDAAATPNDEYQREAGAASNVVHLPIAPDRQQGGAARQRKRNLSGDEQDAFRRIAEALRSFGPPRAPIPEPSPDTDETARRDEAEGRGTVAGEDDVSAARSTAGPSDDPVAVPAPPEPMIADRPQGVPAAVLDKVSAGFLVYRDRHLLFANRALLSRLGYRDTEAFAAAGGVESMFAEASVPDGDEDGARCRVPLRASDGSHIAAEARLHIVPWNDGPATMLSIRDAVPAMSAESAEERRSQQSRIDELEAVLDTATDGILMLDSVGSVLNLNRSAEALFGIEATDVLGTPFTALLADESRQSAIDYLDGLASNGVASVLNDGREVIGRVPDGGLIPIFMTMGRLSEGKFCAVLRDITHWKRAEEELVAARRSAEVASQQKSEFLAKISHEIRTPLNAIIGFSDVILEERFGPIGVERYREYLKDIRVSGAHLASLINDLLDLSRIESGKLDLSFEAVAINSVIKDCVALMQPEANRRRVIIRTSLASDVPKVVADERSLRQIILNLLSNAVKFNGAGGQAIVSTALDATGEVVMRVRDTGVGMTEKEIETALKPFKQIATSGPARFEGTGLGLPLTKALVEANRAQFAITSAPSEGTLVRVAFPIERVLQA